MKFFLLGFLVATAFAVPVPLEDDDGGPVELIVNGVADGEPLELGDVLGVHVNEHINGVMASSTNLLHPLTAVGMAEAAAAAQVPDQSQDVLIPEPVVLPPPVAPEVVVPQPVVIPEPVLPEVIIPEPVELPNPSLPVVVVPEPVVLPEPSLPEINLPVIPEPVVLPEPSKPEVTFPVVPEPVVLPPPSKPEVAFPEYVDVPVAAAQVPNGEVFNNGVVQVKVNTPQEAGVFATVQSWMNFILNYFNEEGTQTTHQII